MKIISMRALSRREFVRMVSLGSLGLSVFRNISSAQQEEYGIPKPTDLSQKQIYGIHRYVGGLYYFDPVGLYVQPGDTVGFILVEGTGRVPTVTAYHPDNDNHELRIPENAKSFDSGIVSPDRRKPAFRWTFEVEGTYDYFSKWEEGAGMVGRIVVGKPGGPGEKPWGYGNKEGRRVIPKKVLERIRVLDSMEIAQKKAVPFPYAQFGNSYPLW